MTAFIRARRQGSLDGVLRSAAAFRSLDDRAVAEQRVNDARERWAAATVAGS